MRLRRRNIADRDETLRAKVRVDRRTKNLIPRLQPGEIAVIHHEDLDRVAAEGLVAARVAAVINGAQSLSGKYPAQGALALLKSGIPVIDGVGTSAFNRIREGDQVCLLYTSPSPRDATLSRMPSSA